MIEENEYGKSCFYKKSTVAVKVDQLPKCYTNQKEIHNTHRVAKPFIFSEVWAIFMLFMHIYAWKMSVNERWKIYGWWKNNLGGKDLELVFILACLLIKVMCCLTPRSPVNWCPNCPTHDILSPRSARCECPSGISHHLTTAKFPITHFV